jgi:hypothetical protein
MCVIMFHPDLPVIDAARIARDQGGWLAWHGKRIRLFKAKDHTGAAIEAVMKGDCEAALVHIGAARRQISELPCPAA